MKEQPVPWEHIISRSTKEEKVPALGDRWTKYVGIGTTWGQAGSGGRRRGLIRNLETAPIFPMFPGAPGTGPQAHIRRGSEEPSAT